MLPHYDLLSANNGQEGRLARQDNAAKFDKTRLGLGYVDDCVILGLNYITNYTYSGNVQANHTVMLQLNLRTLGGTAVSQGVGRPASN